MWFPSSSSIVENFQDTTEVHTSSVHGFILIPHATSLQRVGVAPCSVSLSSTAQSLDPHSISDARILVLLLVRECLVCCVEIALINYVQTLFTGCYVRV